MAGDVYQNWTDPSIRSHDLAKVFLDYCPYVLLELEDMLYLFARIKNRSGVPLLSVPLILQE